MNKFIIFIGLFLWVILSGFSTRGIILNLVPSEIKVGVTYKNPGGRFEENQQTEDLARRIVEFLEDDLKAVDLILPVKVDNFVEEGCNIIGARKNKFSPYPENQEGFSGFVVFYVIDGSTGRVMKPKICFLGSGIEFPDPGPVETDEEKACMALASEKPTQKYFCQIVPGLSGVTGQILDLVHYKPKKRD